MPRLFTFVAALVLAPSLLAPTFCLGQTQPPPAQSQPAFSSPELDALASRVGGIIIRTGKTKVMVLDFEGPEKPLVQGKLLADAFSAALAKSSNNLQVLDRGQLRLQDKDRQSSEREVPPGDAEIVRAKNARQLGKAFGADFVVLGSVGSMGDAVSVTVTP